MKDITPLLKEGKKRIDSYGNGGFVVSGERFDGNIIIFQIRCINFLPTK
jgi:hypothetical protein